MTTASPITDEHVAAWAAFGPKLREKPSNEAELKLHRERKNKMTAMKKKLAVELNDKKRWSGKKIERELDRLVEQLNQVDMRPDYQKENSHPENIVDYREKNGPLLNLLWNEDSKEPLQGQTLYLGGEVGSDGNIYCIPGHAPKVLMIDTKRNEVSLIGPSLLSNIGGGVDTSNGRLYKWLRGIVIGDYIYGLPCHADEILKIHVPTHTITKLHIPYEEGYETAEEAKDQREMIWKYHGGTICPIDNCIYAIPQRANRVLKIEPTTESISFHGPKFDGKCKWVSIRRNESSVFL
jgi:hypothetical protein